MQTGSIAFSTLLLDFDGVIVESTDIKTQAFAEMFGDYPEHLDAIIDYHKRHAGISRFVKFKWIYRELLKQPLSESKLKRLGEQFREIVYSKIIRAPFVRGALETITSYRSMGIPIFIISATPHDELDCILHARQLKDYITESWGTPTEKRAAIRRICSTYGKRPDEMLFVGDGLLDYEAATGEGVPFLARDLGEAGFDWSHRGVASVPDLTVLAGLSPDHPVTLSCPDPHVSQLTLTLKEGVVVHA